MFKLLIIALIVSGASVYGVSATAAQAVAMPDGPGSARMASVDASEPVADATSGAGPMHESSAPSSSRGDLDVAASVHKPVHGKVTGPAHSGVGADATAPAHKAHGASWQSLLPGVMK